MLEWPASLSKIGICIDCMEVDYGQLSQPQATGLLREQLALEKGNQLPVLASHTLLPLRAAFRALSEPENKVEADKPRRLDLGFG
jgi:hypothetical protein